MYEFDRMIEAWKVRTEKQRRQEALWVANLMNATGNFKEPVTVDKLVAGKTANVIENENMRRRAEERRLERLRERKRRERNAR